MDLALPRSCASVAAPFAVLASDSGAAADSESVKAERSRLRAADFPQMLRERADAPSCQRQHSPRREAPLRGEALTDLVPWGRGPKDLPQADREPAAKAGGGRRGVSAVA
ncbi:MAG TPA: hypothetical protein DEP35_05320 [Deltaproteobacteria bacterium]|nr:hypothetical protein [Deltaproteobacteria bacterium]